MKKKGSEWDKHPERSPKMEVSPTVTGGNIPPSGKKSSPKKGGCDEKSRILRFHRKPVRGLRDLVKLRELCRSILSEPAGEQRNRKAMELLPPHDGYFFGSTKTDDWYYEDLKYTVEVLDGISADDYDEYVYEASG